MPRSFLLRFWFLALLAAQPVLTLAYCMDNRHPSVSKEVLDSNAVVIGEVTKATDLTEDPSDPEGITATIYQVRVVSVLRGQAAGMVDIRSENTSSRFPMEPSKRYVLFLLRDDHGYFVDNCGNSGRLSDRKNVITALKHIQPDARLTPQSSGPAGAGR